MACSHCRRGQDNVRVADVNKLLVANWKVGRDETKLIETGSRQDKTVLSAV